MLLAERPEVLIAQTEVQRESIARAEIVVGIPVQHVFTQIDLGQPGLDLRLLR